MLGDEPVIVTPPDWAIGDMYLVPLSPKVLIAGGTEAAHSALRDPQCHILTMGINGLAMSFSNRFVYARRLLELDALGSMFEDTGDSEHEAWMREAKEPHFGLERVISQASDEEINTFRREREELRRQGRE